MRASEKLRALDAAIQRDEDYQDESVVLDAIPQIVAVVEAAEATDKRTREIEEAHELSPNELGLSLRTALAALDEAL